jgi:hypothetical protein
VLPKEEFVLGFGRVYDYAAGKSDRMAAGLPTEGAAAGRPTPRGCEASSARTPGRPVMKWTGMYLLGFVILVGGLLAALWKLGILATIGTTWTVIGVVIALGIGIMISVASSGTKESIEIDRR